MYLYPSPLQIAIHPRPLFDRSNPRWYAVSLVTADTIRPSVMDFMHLLTWYVFSFLFLHRYLCNSFSTLQATNSQARIFFFHRQFLSNSNSINYIESANDCKFSIFSSSIPPPPSSSTHQALPLSSKSIGNLYFASHASLSLATITVTDDA